VESSSRHVPPPGGIFVQPDFAGVWNALVQDSDLRDAAFDLAYWEEYAADYDLSR
jgi:hypothetical protein